MAGRNRSARKEPEIDRLRTLVVRARAAEMLLLFARNALARNAESGRLQRAREDVGAALNSVADIAFALNEIVGEDQWVRAELALSASAQKIAAAEVRAAQRP